MESTELLTTKNLTKVYASGKIQVVALDDANLSVSAGRMVGVSGSSGSGKSTLLNLIGGLDSPSSGSIEVEGKLISDFNKEELARYRRYGVGMIFQSFNLISSLTAMENVALPLLFAGIPRKERKSRAMDLLEKLGLSQRSHHRPAELSGGEQQRVAIARALVNQPKMLLADEPTGNLDSLTSRDIMRVLADLNENQGLTLLIVSHETVLLQELCHELIHLCDGRIVDKET